MVRDGVVRSHYELAVWVSGRWRIGWKSEDVVFPGDTARRARERRQRYVVCFGTLARNNVGGGTTAMFSHSLSFPLLLSFTYLLFFFIFFAFYCIPEVPEHVSQPIT